jgi:hypothetical protein
MKQLIGVKVVASIIVQFTIHGQMLNLAQIV